MFNRKRGRPTRREQEARTKSISVDTDETPKLTGRLLTVEEVSERLQVHQQTVYTWVKLGRLVPVRIGRSIRFDENRILAPASLN